MSSVDLDIKDKTVASDESDLREPQNTPDGHKPSKNSRRLMPAILATLFSILWTGLTGYYLLTDSAISVTSAVEMASLVAGYSTPIAIFWLIALTFQRTDPLLERRLAISQNLHKAVAPVEIAEQRLADLNKNLTRELTNIDAVADLASDRLKNLEDRFQSQISDLFTATADTEARTVSIRDILAREKESLSTLTQEIETRMTALESVVGEINTQVEGAGLTAAASADHARERVNSSLDAFGQATEDFEARLDRASANVTGRVNEVQDIAVEVELRLQAVTNKVLGGMERFRGDVEGLEGRSAELSEHMTTQGRVLKELADLAALESAKIEATLKSHVGEVKTAATEALESTHSVSEVFSERAQNMSEQMVQTITSAKSMLEEAGESMQAHCAAALQTSEEVAERTRASTEETGKQVLEHAQQVDQVLEDGLQRAKRSLEAAMEAVASHSATAVEEAESAAERTLQHIRQLRDGVEQQMVALTTAGDQAGEKLAGTASKISDQASNLSARAQAATTDMEQVQGKMAAQEEDISALLNDTRLKLSHLEDDLMRQRDALNAASNEAAEKVIEATERFVGNSQSLKEAVVETESAISEKATALGAQIIDLDTKSSAAASSLEESGKAVQQQSSDLDAALAKSSTNLGTAANAFAGERERITSESEKVVERLDASTAQMDQQLVKFTESSMDAADKLDNASQALMDQTTRAEEQMKRSVEETGKELSASLNHISDEATNRVTVLQEQMETALTKVLDDYQKSAENAEKESALLAMRLGSESQKIAQQAEQFIEKTAEIEKRIVSATKNDFARTSQLLLEGLQSASIDVNKALSHDVPDHVWSSYLDGDKSVFMRRTLKIADRKTKKTIAEKFESDAGFRDTVTRFFNDFEGLMERVMLGDKGSALSVTLISSDMGKLYILLAQSLKKIS